MLGAVGVALWATETTLINYTTAIPPLQTVTIAFLFAALMSPLVWRITGADPMAAFRQPVSVWLLVVTSLVGYHACIYYATQQAPPAAAALLQGTTPLMIVFGSALLPGERLRWWHIVGALTGLCGILLLIDYGAETVPAEGNAVFYLSLIGIAAALWGLYSIISRSFPEVPSSALGVFYAASAVIAGVGHLLFEGWAQPQPSEWAAMAALGIFPMGLAIYFWDFGMKRGDIQALGAFSYVEPFIGALLVAIFTSGTLDWNVFSSGCLVVSGAILASKSLWTVARDDQALPNITPSESDISIAGNRVLERLIAIRRNCVNLTDHSAEIMELLDKLAVIVDIWDQVQSNSQFQSSHLVYAKKQKHEDCNSRNEPAKRPKEHSQELPQLRICVHLRRR